MVFFFSRTQKTKVFAEVLQKILNMPLYELRSSLNTKNFFNMVKGCILAFMKKPYSVYNMPEDITDSEIYICSPIWAGQIAPPVRYFLQNADLSQRKVNLLLTCASFTGSDTYCAAALEVIHTIPCIPGKAYVFATTNEMPDRAVIEEQIKKMMFSDDET